MARGVIDLRIGIRRRGNGFEPAPDGIQLFAFADLPVTVVAAAAAAAAAVLARTCVTRTCDSNVTRTCDSDV